MRWALFDANETGVARLCHVSVQSNHLHLLVEAPNRERLWLGMQGFAIRLAKRLNKWWQRKGRVFGDRYHARILRTPREVRNALAYVLNNHRRHGVRDRAARTGAPDTYSSGRWFDGWRSTHVPGRREPGRGSPVRVARTWLLARGWRRHGLVRFDEIPGARRRSARGP